jgi:hypothetical protein
MSLPIHPAAALFPEMNQDDYIALRSDIAARGLIEPVWVHDGQLLDGRHRARACDDLGIPCPSRLYEGPDPVGFVISLNLHRRMLNESQRALIAARLANLKNGRPSRNSPNLESFSTEQAAKALHVGRGTVSNAQALLRSDRPQQAALLIEQVESGDLKVSAAVRELKKLREAEKLTEADVREAIAEKVEQIARAQEQIDQAKRCDALATEINKPFEDCARRYTPVSFALRQALEAWQALGKDEAPMHETVRLNLRQLLTQLGELLDGTP